LGPTTVAALGADHLDAPVTVLTPAAAKGLEVDTVVLVEPGAILDESPLGARDLYVAMTRCTQRLRVLHSTPVPLMRLG
jgi:DNA helicase IV